MKAKFFFPPFARELIGGATRCLRQRAIPVPWQLQYPGYATAQLLAGKKRQCGEVIHE